MTRVSSICLVLTLLLFGAAGTIGTAFNPQSGNNDDFLRVYHAYAWWVCGASLLCAVIWFALAEWVISAWTAASTWVLTWLVLLLVVVAVSIYLAYLVPESDGGAARNDVITYYLLIGLVPFYLCGVLFSPTNAKFTVWPAKLARRW